jgi:hypothetical protein
VLPGGHLVAGARDPLGQLAVQQAELGVHARGRGLDAAEPAHHGRRHGLARNLEVLDRLARLRAPQLVLNRHRVWRLSSAKSCSGRVDRAARRFPCSDRSVTALTRIGPSAAPAAADPTASVRFCSRCGRRSDQPRGHLHVPQRVCDECEMGVLLTCRRDAFAEEAAAAFLICTYELTVSAVSEAAEEIFGSQDGLVGADLLELATCPLGDEQLARHAALAAQRAREPVVVPMRLRSERGAEVGMLAARIATCGPPRAALVTVERTGFGRR